MISKIILLFLSFDQFFSVGFSYSQIQSDSSPKSFVTSKWVNNKLISSSKDAPKVELIDKKYEPIPLIIPKFKNKYKIMNGSGERTVDNRMPENRFIDLFGSSNDDQESAGEATTTETTSILGNIWGREESKEEDEEEDTEEEEEEEEDDDDDDEDSENVDYEDENKKDKKKKKKKKKGEHEHDYGDSHENTDNKKKMKKKDWYRQRRRQYYRVHKIIFPMLLAYKLKFFTLLPILFGTLVLLVGTTGIAGFFFALFAAAMGINKSRH